MTEPSWDIPSCVKHGLEEMDKHGKCRWDFMVILWTYFMGYDMINNSQSRCPGKSPTLFVDCRSERQSCGIRATILRGVLKSVIFGLG